MTDDTERELIARLDAWGEAIVADDGDRIAGYMADEWSSSRGPA